LLAFKRGTGNARHKPLRPPVRQLVQSWRAAAVSMLWWTFHFYSECAVNFSLNFIEHDVSINQDTWAALATTGSDVSFENVKATILGVLERNGTFTVEDSNDQVVRRIETPAEFEGYMQEMELQRKQFQQEQA